MTMTERSSKLLSLTLMHLKQGSNSWTPAKAEVFCLFLNGVLTVLVAITSSGGCIRTSPFVCATRTCQQTLRDEIVHENYPYEVSKFVCCRRYATECFSFLSKMVLDVAHVWHDGSHGLFTLNKYTGKAYEFYTAAASRRQALLYLFVIFFFCE